MGFIAPSVEKAGERGGGSSLGGSTGRRDRSFRRSTAVRQVTRAHVWRWCWSRCCGRDEKDRVMRVVRRIPAEPAIEALWGGDVRSGPSGRRTGDKSRAAVERGRLFLQTQFWPEPGPIRQAVVSRAAGMRRGGDEPSARSGGCGRTQAAVRVAGIGAGTR